MSSPYGHASNGHLDVSQSDSAGSPQSSPWRRAVDSPSKQLLLELGHLHLNYDRELHARLDQDYDQRAKEHDLALAAAVKEHEYVRRDAERARERVQLRIAAERRRQEAEENQELEQERQRKLEEEIHQQRRKIEESRRTEERRRAAEEAKAQAEAEEKRRIQKERADAEEALRQASQREAEEKAHRIQEAAKTEALMKATAAKPSNRLDATSTKAQPDLRSLVSDTSRSLPTAVGSSHTEQEGSHLHYLQLHQRLKEMRQFMVEQRKQNPELKKRMSDGRHMIKQSVGQLTQGVGANKIPLTRLRTILNDATKFQHPSIDVRPFILKPIENLSTADAQVPALLIYLLNIFSKAVITQFVNEAAVTPAAADPTGIIAISIFAAPEFRWKSMSFIDMLIAKYHVVCPVLFGVYGDEKTEGGRKRLGWMREEAGGPWVSEQRHGERMTGLGAGFAALTLRDFKNSKNVNPFPHRHYWNALACIVNTPPQSRTTTHFLVLKAMIELSVPRFLHFYGQAGIVALRKALIDFPRDSHQKGVAAMALSTVPEILKSNLHLTL